MRMIVILTLLLWGSITLEAQEIVLEKDLSKSVYNKKLGINHTSYVYIFADYNFYVFTSSRDIDIIPVKSHNFACGFRGNRRIYGAYSTGASLFYFIDNFSLDQNKNKVFPTVEQHKTEKMQKHNLALDFYNRIVLKKEYNQLGIYIDAGIYGTYAIATLHKMKDVNDDPIYQGKTKELIIKRLTYVEPFNYGVMFRLGYNKVYLATYYRLNKWLKGDYSMFRIPKVSVGVGVGLY